MDHSRYSMTRRRFVGAVLGGVAGTSLSRGVAAQESAASKPEFTFGLVTDAQYWDGDAAGSRYYRNSLKKLRVCVDDLNSKDLTCVLHLGDFIDRNFASFDAPLAIYDELEAPRYFALGNHDFSVADARKPEVPGKLGMKRGYYDFTHGNWRFIVLDGNDVGMIASVEGTDAYKQADAVYQALKEQDLPNAQTWNGAVGTAQLEWLKKTLTDATEAGQKALVFCHFPVYPANAHNLWNDQEVVRVVESFECVAAYINGHNHAGNYGVKDGIHYLTLQGMVETPDTSAYAVIEVHPDHLSVVGEGREPDRTLAF